MTKDTTKEENNKPLREEEEPGVDYAGDGDVSDDVNSIQEFIERKKLQNRILQKMIENINQSEHKDNSKPKSKSK